MVKRTPKFNISEAEIRAVYRQGEEAVVELVSSLVSRLAEVEARLEKLENQQKKNSRNSSKPPSGDGFGKRTKSLRKKSERNSGAQRGHRGSTLEWHEQVDEVVTHPVNDCHRCGVSLASVSTVEYERRQVHELPPLGLQVIEHQVEVKCCPACAAINRGVFPTDVTVAVQYGNGLRGLMVYLMSAQLLPSERTRELLSEVFGCDISEGTLYNARVQCFEQLEPVEQQIKQCLETAALQTILDSMGDAVVVTDINGEATLLNPAAKQLFEGEALEKSFDNWTHHHRLFASDGTSPLDAKAHPLGMAARGISVDAAELKISGFTQSNEPLSGQPCANNETDGRWFSVNARPLTETDALIGAVAVFRDISEQKKTEKALEKSRDRSQHQAQLLKQTLKELKAAQASLVQSEKMDSLGKTVAGIAHEINNPINFIHGNLSHAQDAFQDLLMVIELCRKTYPNATPELNSAIEGCDLDFLAEDIPKLFKSMQTGTGRVREIVETLRSFSRLDEADVKAVNIHEGLDSALMILQPTFNEHKTPIKINRIYGELPLVECHARQLNQAFVSILENAGWALSEADNLEATFQPEIVVRTEQRDHHIIITIADNGIGIPDADQSKVFDPFFTTKPVGQGTGLGLSTCYQTVVETHGGNVQCFSKEGKGTQFVITLPFTQEKGH